MTTPTYSIALWDHAPQPHEPYDYPRHWSHRLAAAHLGGRACGLTWHELRRALRALRGVWECETILIVREGLDYTPGSGDGSSYGEVPNG